MLSTGKPWLSGTLTLPSSFQSKLPCIQSTDFVLQTWEDKKTDEISYVLGKSCFKLIPDFIRCYYLYVGIHKVYNFKSGWVWSMARDCHSD